VKDPKLEARQQEQDAGLAVPPKADGQQAKLATVFKAGALEPRAK